MHFPHWLQLAIEQYGYWVILLAVALESMGVPFPGETSLLAGAVYAGTGGRLNIVGVILAAAVGAIGGDNIGYSVGRYGGYPLLRRILRALHVPESALGYTQAFFAQHGNKTVFFSRFASVLRTTVPFLSGVNAMPWRAFIIWNALGGVIWAIIYGTLGFVLGHNLPLLGSVLAVLGAGGAAVVVIALIVVLALWLLGRRQRAQGRPSLRPRLRRHRHPRTPDEEAARQQKQLNTLSATSQRSGDLVVGLAAEQQRLRQRKHPPKPTQPSAPEAQPPPPATPEATPEVRH